jgi:protein tyrosine phosphatase (PTP) superfamily phosphohydrolase (DUF442 family)
MDAPPVGCLLFTRRRLLRAGLAVVGLGITAEALRVFAFSNQHAIIRCKAYRSAQLSPEQLDAAIRSHGIRTVINLRGTCPDTRWYDGEARVTHAANVSQEDLSFSAKRLPAPDEVRRMLEILDHTEWPILIHCQRGADRTGLVSTTVLLLYTNATLAEARRQLWPRYGHIRGGRTIVIDEFFEQYESWLAGRPHTPELFRDWATNHYCPGSYRAELALVGDPKPTVPAGRGFSVTVRAKNTSIEPWHFHTGGAGGIQLRAILCTPGGLRIHTARAGFVEAIVEPGQSRDFTLGFPPLAEPGRYLVCTDLLDKQPIDLHDADFVQYGSVPLIFDVIVK